MPRVVAIVICVQHWSIQASGVQRSPTLFYSININYKTKLSLDPSNETFLSVSVQANTEAECTIRTRYEERDI